MALAPKVPNVKTGHTLCNKVLSLKISIKEIKSIENCSRSTATRRIKQCQGALGLAAVIKITRKQYLDYFEIDISKTTNPFL